MTFVNMECIEKHFNNNVVLKDVSLQMNKGEIVSIMVHLAPVSLHFCAV